MRLDIVRRLGFPVPDGRGDLLYAASFFLAYVVIDLITRNLANYDTEAAGGPSLLYAALRSNLATALVSGLVIAIAIWQRPERWLSPWTDLERGKELRRLIAPLLFLLTWQSAFHQYNYLLERAHLGDRVLVVALAVAALQRPLFLIPFVLQSRVIAEQFGLPYGTLAAQNVDELLLVVLLAVVGAHLVYVATGRIDSAPVVLVICAALATFFFIPGRGKVLLGWLGDEDLANLASSGYAVGWLGQTDGALARWFVGTVDSIGLPLRLLTVLIEVGAVIVVVNYRWFRLWLPLIIGFHVVNFLFLGFWFLAWIVLEVALILLFTRPTLREWLGRNLSLGRAAMTAITVGLFGPLLFHPPGLAWLDSPVAYGYQIEVVGSSGARYNLPIRSFAPFEQELTFDRLQLGANHRLSGAYGVVASSEQLLELQQLENLEELAALEEPLGSTNDASSGQAEDFLRSFIDYANARADGNNDLAGALDVVQPFSKFWTGSPEPHYQFQESIVSLEVFQLTSLRVGDDFHHRRSSVLALDQSR